MAFRLDDRQAPSERAAAPTRSRILLVASSGGHLAELVRLRDAWIDREVSWVSFPTSDAQVLLEGESVCWAHYPTNRNIPNLLRNARLAWRHLRAARPDVVVSTGAGVAVPFLILARVLRMRTVYIESITRIDELSLTGRLVYPFVHAFLVQWEPLAKRFRRAEFGGSVL